MHSSNVEVFLVKQWFRDSNKRYIFLCRFHLLNVFFSYSVVFRKNLLTFFFNYSLMETCFFICVLTL